MCASLFSSCCINYIAPHPPTPFHTPVLPPLPVIVAHLLVVFIANYYFLLIFAHIFIFILFLALANELCAMQQAAPELGVAASPLFYSPHDPNGVCLCNFCGKLRVVCPAAVLHPFNPFSSLRPRLPPTPCRALVDLGDGCSVRHAACGRANLYNGSLNSFTYNAYHICIAT